MAASRIVVKLVGSEITSQIQVSFSVLTELGNTQLRLKLRLGLRPPRKRKMSQDAFFPPKPHLIFL